MKVNCPHCSQRIELGDSPPPAFSCPSCGNNVSLAIQDTTTPVNLPMRTKGSQAVWILASLLTIFVAISAVFGWLHWGKRSQLALNDQLIGRWEHSRNYGDIEGQTLEVRFEFFPNGVMEFAFTDQPLRKGAYQFIAESTIAFDLGEGRKESEVTIYEPYLYLFGEAPDTEPMKFRRLSGP